MSGGAGAGAAGTPSLTGLSDPPAAASEAGRRTRDDRPAGAVWSALASLLGLTAIVGALLPPDWHTRLDWQPTLAGAEPWRMLSAVAVHYSAWHLAANLAGVAAVAALGQAARLPWRCTLAWALAWPATQLGLLVQPALLHYGGLSGVLHAGVAVAAVHLLWRARGARRAIGAALGAGLLVKLIGETPWGAPLRQPPDWDIAVAPLGHATGALAGVVCSSVAEAWRSVRVPAVAA